MSGPPAASTPHTFPVMGVPLEFVSESSALHAAVHGCFGYWHTLDPSETSATPAGVLTLRLRDGMEAAVMSPVTYEVDGPRALSLRVGASTGWVDADRRVGEADLTQALLDQRDVLCTGVLQTLALVLVTARGRWPLHAAMIEREGHAVLLAGPSGSGKSTLAYAAHRRGWNVHADDTVFLETGSPAVIWTNHFRFRLDPEVVTWYPDLADARPEWTANGKERVIVAGPRLPPAPFRGPLTTVLLDDGVGDTAPTPRTGSEMVGRLLDRLEPGFDLDPAAAARVAELVGGRGGWMVARAAHPDETIRALEATLYRPE